MRNILLLILSIFLISNVFGGIITQEYHFESPVIVEKAGTSILVLENCSIAGLPGQPSLPAYGAKLLLPPGEVIISVEISTSLPEIVYENAYISPVPEPHPISFQGPIIPTLPDPAIYGSNNPFPAELSANVQTYFMCGYSIGYLAVYPVQYRPISGEISYYPTVTVKVTTASAPNAASAYAQNYRRLASDRSRLQAKVDNPEYAVNYGPVLSGTDDPQIPYLLITTSSLASYFDPLVEFKNNCGLTVEVVLTSEIGANYPGEDNPEKIRNCIIDYYQNYNTTFVLLGADNEFLPHRGLYATLAGETDPDIAGDIYFAGLDGNWDANNDNLYGQPGEGDLVAEVYVGRAAVDSPTEVTNFVNKQLMFQTSPVSAEIEKGLMVGEDLGWTVWGSDLKEEIRLGTTTTTGFPDNFRVTTLYDVPGWWFSGTGDLIPLLNQGYPYVNHMGHADVGYMMKLYTSSVNDNNMTNNGVNHNFYIVYSQGCYCGSFDNRTAGGSYTSDCITEQFNVIANGAVCLVTNSRYGWGNDVGTNGPSQYYDREFFDALFGENISQIGIVNQDSKEDNIPYINNATLWCYYELNLFGDPTLDMWTVEPMALSPVYNPTVFIGAQEFSVEIPGLEGALCAISNEAGLLGSEYTNAQGEAEIEFSSPISTLENLTLMITAHNYLPYTAEIVVITPNIPYVVVDNMSVNDLTLGDGDSTLDLGESGYFAVDFHNVGLQPANSVYALISTTDQYVALMSDSVFLGTILPEAIIQTPEAFEYEVSSQVVDGHSVEFTITLKDALDSTWIQDDDFIISAPVITITSVQIYDGQNMRLEPGETAQLEVVLSNTGSGELRNCTASVMTDNPFITLNINSGSVTLIEPGMNSTITPNFDLTASPGCPENSIIPFYLALEDEPGYQRQIIFEVVAGGFYDNMENGVGAWTHDNITYGYWDEWGMNTYRNHSYNGSHSWHDGNQNGGTYQGLTDAGLVTPVMQLGNDGKLVFWHFMDAETSASYPGQAYDGGFVEMSLNGSVFFQIFPEGGYPYIVRQGSTQTGPFPASTPFYSGLFDWQQAVFNLSLYPAGQVQFRFRFGADAQINREGWYIDDVELVPIISEPPSNFNAELETGIVHLSWNSPGLPGGSAVKNGGMYQESLLHYDVYRNGQLLADEVCTLEYDDDLTSMPYGNYSYYVGAVYNEGIVFTQPITIEYNGTGVEAGMAGIPEHYYIEPNYPNPFNPSTNFNFGLPEGGEVSLTIYNIYGQEVERLMEGYRPAGNYRLSWNAQGLPSGIYFFRFSTAKYSNCGKMLLLK